MRPLLWPNKKRRPDCSTAATKRCTAEKESERRFLFDQRFSAYFPADGRHPWQRLRACVVATKKATIETFPAQTSAEKTSTVAFFISVSF
jgi:hypothetical protein